MLIFSFLWNVRNRNVGGAFRGSAEKWCCHIGYRKSRGVWFALMARRQIDICGTVPHSGQQHSTGICRIVLVPTWGNHDQDQVRNCYQGGDVCEPSFAVVIYHGINYTHTYTSDS